MSTTLDSPVSHASSHHEHGDHRLFGLTLFLVAEGMIFFGLFAAYLTFRAVNSLPPEQMPELELLLPGVNTGILLSSSLVINRAQKAIRADDVAGVQKAFGVTALMGAVFLVGQLYEYSQLSFGLKDNLFASTFYVLTGFHGLHVLVGLLAILAVLWRSRRPGHYSSRSHFGIEAAEYYWHFVDIVWVILFVLLYLL
jgi:cytochrome c oxidase subunit 3